MIKLIILVLSLILVVFILGHQTYEYVTVVNEPGVLKELRLNNIIDRDQKYKVGQSYLVEYNLLFGKLVKTNIELIE